MGIGADEKAKKAQELLVAVVGSALAHHLALMNSQGCIEGGGAVPACTQKERRSTWPGRRGRVG